MKKQEDPESRKRRFEVPESERKEGSSKEKKAVGFMEDVVIKKSRIEREKEAALMAL